MLLVSLPFRLPSMCICYAVTNLDTQIQWWFQVEDVDEISLCDNFVAAPYLKLQI